jgi:hypothetical protein
VTQITPAVLRHLHSELLGSFSDAFPRDVAFSLADALDLVEASYCVSHMTGIDQWFLALVGGSELFVTQSVFFGCVQSFAHPDSSRRLTDLMPPGHLIPLSVR